MPSQAYWGKVSDWSCLDFGWKSFDLSLISVPQASPISSSRYHHWSPWIPHPSFVPVTSASQIYNSLVRNSGAFDGCSCRNCTSGGGLCHIWCTPPLAPGAPSHCLLIHVTNVPTVENRTLYSCCSLLDWQPGLQNGGLRRELSSRTGSQK